MPERWSITVLKVLIFITAMSHGPAKPFNMSWRPDSEEASKTKSSMKSNHFDCLPFTKKKKQTSGWK